jgi:hypothetical protein
MHDQFFVAVGQPTQQHAEVALGLSLGQRAWLSATAIASNLSAFPHMSRTCSNYPIAHTNTGDYNKNMRVSGTWLVRTNTGDYNNNMRVSGTWLVRLYTPCVGRFPSEWLHFSILKPKSGAAIQSEAPPTMKGDRN